MALNVPVGEPARSFAQSIRRSSARVKLSMRHRYFAESPFSSSPLIFINPPLFFFFTFVFLFQKKISLSIFSVDRYVLSRASFRVLLSSYFNWKWIRAALLLALFHLLLLLFLILSDISCLSRLFHEIENKNVERKWEEENRNSWRVSRHYSSKVKNLRGLEKKKIKNKKWTIISFSLFLILFVFKDTWCTVKNLLYRVEWPALLF